MKKKIYLSIALITSLAVLFVSIVLCIIFYNQLSLQIRSDLREHTQIFVNHDINFAQNLLVYENKQDVRFTLIQPDGTVVFDNLAHANEMENHLSRSEVSDALVFGVGESNRFSDTIQIQTYYYAVRLSDGSVLRIAKTNSSIWNIFSEALPATMIVMLIMISASYFIANRLAIKLVEPIHNVDLSGTPDVPYDELAPFVKTIVNHQKQIEKDNEKLRSRQDTINAIMSNMNEGVVLLDKNGIVLSVNKSASNIFENIDAIEGKNSLELLRDLDFSGNIKKALHGYKNEMILQKSEKEYRVLISPVSETGVIVFFLDVTEKSAAEKMRREFSANVSHELKTPLTSIYGNAEILSAGVVKAEDAQMFYKKIMGETSRLIDLIEDIIMLSELDEENVLGHMKCVNLLDIANECKNALQAKSAECQISINIIGHAEMLAHHTLMHELFYNLIDNAIKYNKPNGCVDVSISNKNGKSSIIVADNGIGISEADQLRIFERFYCADKSHSKKTGGTGLGLAIVKHIVMVHNGTITVESQKDKGTRFEIIF